MRRRWRGILGWIGVFAIVLGGLALLSKYRLPSLEGRSVSRALTETSDTRLGRAIATKAAQHPGHTGVVPLADGRDAFAARARLADVAERSIDVQYYIWKQDLSGTLLFRALLRAADRGVRVRFLLDDNNTPGLGPILAALNAHPNIEVRLFNPFQFRRWRALGYLTDFNRLNRRMHNKSFTVDNQVTIIGGRNIGDEYFDASHPVLFMDLDVMAAGPVVREVSQDFDAYWASESSYPAERILSASAEPADLTELDVIEESDDARAYLEALDRQPFVKALLDRTLEFEWTHVRMISDDPAKGLGRAGPGEIFLDRLRDVLETPRGELQLVSPYFVPTASGTAQLTALAREGVQVSILTNSLESSDFLPVYAAYAKWRQPLLESGIRLFELRESSAAAGGELRDRGLPGSSGSSLHAKTFAVDRERIFIGSYNFDPRSAQLNTEIGFLIDSPLLAQALATRFETRFPEMAYEARINDDGAIVWVERGDWRSAVHEEEPGATWWRRTAVWILARLPIEWLL